MFHKSINVLRVESYDSGTGAVGRQAAVSDSTPQRAGVDAGPLGGMASDSNRRGVTVCREFCALMPPNAFATCPGSHVAGETCSVSRRGGAGPRRASQLMRRPEKSQDTMTGTAALGFVACIGIVVGIAQDFTPACRLTPTGSGNSGWRRAGPSTSSPFTWGCREPPPSRRGSGGSRSYADRAPGRVGRVERSARSPCSRIGARVRLRRKHGTRPSQRSLPCRSTSRRSSSS